MARPTDEKKDRTVKVRISDDLYTELVKKGPNLSKTIRDILKDGFSVPQNVAEEKISVEVVPKNPISPETMAGLNDLKDMAGCFGMELEDLVHKLCDLFYSDKIMVSGGKICVKKEPWVEEFESVCHDLCIPVEKAAEGAIKVLKRGGF